MPSGRDASFYVSFFSIALISLFITALNIWSWIASSKFLNLLTFGLDDDENGEDDMEEDMDGDEGGDDGACVGLFSMISMSLSISMIELLLIS